jgi:hypothetical protein
METAISAHIYRFVVQDVFMHRAWQSFMDVISVVLILGKLCWLNIFWRPHGYFLCCHRDRTRSWTCLDQSSQHEKVQDSSVRSHSRSSNGANRSDCELNVLGVGDVRTRAMTLHWIIGVKLKETTRVDMRVACFINVERSIHVSCVWRTIVSWNELLPGSRRQVLDSN